MRRIGGSLLALAIIAVAAACADSAVAPGPSEEPSGQAADETRLYRDEALDVEFEMPSSWNAGAAPMPYASCFTCLVIGPGDASPPYGIEIYRVTLDYSGPECGNEFGGCPIMGHFGIRGLPNGDEVRLTVAGLDAAQQRIFRQPPLGLTNEADETRPYHEIATGVDRPGDDFLIVGFYREDDDVGRREVEVAYERLLESLVVE